MIKMDKIENELLDVAERIARNGKSWVPKKKWQKSRDEPLWIRWFKEDPYREIDVIKYYDGWWIFYNNRGIHKRSYKTKTRALKSAKSFMKRV